jgi:hypothetical protein
MVMAMELVDVERRSEDLARYVRQEVERAPVRTVALAFAAGYVLGGGLTPRALRLVALNAGRAMAGNFVAAAMRGALDERRTA